MQSSPWVCSECKVLGQGIATAALKMAVPNVFKEFPGLARLEAFLEVENQGSQKVLDKIGFLKEGLLRKYQVWVLQR